jgi:hypothetical protein
MGIHASRAEKSLWLVSGCRETAVAACMGTSVEILQKYYGKSATASKFATGLRD